MSGDVPRLQCCFCGNQIVNLNPDPLTLTIHFGEQEQQTLFSHYRCLKRSVDSSVPLIPLADE